MLNLFYTLAQPVDGVGGAEFTRNNVNCVQCHTSEATMNIPGWFVGSVYPKKDGLTAYGPAYTTDHRTPFDIRWGGWYVTGRHRGERHLGNAVVTDTADLASMVTPASVHVVTSPADSNRQAICRRTATSWRCSSSSTRCRC